MFDIETLNFLVGGVAAKSVGEGYMAYIVFSFGG